MIKNLLRVPDWLWLALISASLRLVNIGQESLWYDESFTAWLSKLKWPNLWAAIQGDVHPPLWYLLEWVNVRLFGNSEIALRMPAALLGIVCVLLVWQLAKHAGFQRHTAFIAGMFAATLPAAVYYAQDARMYPMLACFILLAALAAIRENWLLFTVASAGALYAQNLSVFYIFSIGAVVVISRWRTWRTLIKPMLAGIAALIAYLPWAPHMLHQAQQVSKGFWLQPLTLGGSLWPLGAMTMGVRVDPSLQVHVYGAAIGISLVGLIASRKWILHRPGLIVLAVVFIAPLVAALVSVLWRSVYLPRALLPSSLGLCLLWAYPLKHLSRPNRSVAQAIVTPMLLIALVSHYFPSTNARFPLRDWANTIQTNWQSGDVIYHIAIDSCILFGYYLPDKPYVLLPHVGDLNQSLTEDTKSAMGFNQGNFEALRAQGFKRAWLVATTNPMTSAAQLHEIQRLKQLYPWHIVREQHNEVAAQTIYLVDLSTEI